MSSDPDTGEGIGAGHPPDAHDANQGAWGPPGSIEEDPVVAQPALYLGGAFAGGVALAMLVRWLRG